MSCLDYSYMILYSPGMSSLEINGSESSGPAQQAPVLTFRLSSAFKNDIQLTVLDSKISLF